MPLSGPPSIARIDVLRTLSKKKARPDGEVWPGRGRRGRCAAVNWGRVQARMSEYSIILACMIRGQSRRFIAVTQKQTPKYSKNYSEGIAA
jgi:hypothetical protein